MATGPKKVENRGGARPGSGRKRTRLSDDQVHKLIKAAVKKERETGISVGDRLIGIIYNNRATNAEKIAAIKAFYDHTITKASESDVNVTKFQEPAFYLPESLPDPAKVVVIAGGKK